MSKKSIWAFVVVAAALAACKPAPAKPKTPEPEQPGRSAPLQEKAPFNIGDVESGVQLETLVADASKSPSVKAEEMRNAKGDLDLLTVSVALPRPEQFFVTFSLRFHISFSDGPVALRITVFRDNQPVDMYGVILDEHSKAPFDRTMDILAGASGAPPSMLVHAQAEVVLLPKGTDVSKADPLTVTGTPETTGSILSNPMRIDFAAAEGAP